VLQRNFSPAATSAVRVGAPTQYQQQRTNNIRSSTTITTTTTSGTGNTHDDDGEGGVVRERHAGAALDEVQCGLARRLALQEQKLEQRHDLLLHGFRGLCAYVCVCVASSE
jgi:hypothetical protein